MLEQKHNPHASLVQRIEDLVSILQNSSVGEIELVEDGTEISIKRQSGANVPASVPKQQTQGAQTEVKTTRDYPGEEDHSIAIVAPLTGVFYTSPSPDLPPFIKIGDVIQPRQVVAMIEAMKVFNEIQADVVGRLTQINAESGFIVKKGAVLFRIEPI